MNICQINPNCILEINKKDKRVSIYPCDPKTDKYKNAKDKKVEVYLLEASGNLIFIQKISDPRELEIHRLKSIPIGLE
ncbi:MAG: hypothetical protein IE887_06915 [Campylobacterales bacterium]|nr:hypothetical protein [Campylobacterales bacterium]